MMLMCGTHATDHVWRGQETSAYFFPFTFMEVPRIELGAPGLPSKPCYLLWQVEGSKSATVGVETPSMCRCVLPSLVPLNHFAEVVQKQLTQASKWHAVSIKSSDSRLVSTMLTLRIKRIQLLILFCL